MRMYAHITHKRHATSQARTHTVQTNLKLSDVCPVDVGGGGGGGGGSGCGVQPVFGIAGICHI